MELGWTYPKRKKLIEDLIKAPSSKTDGINFQGTLQYLSIYSISMGLPKYRLNNGRTYAAQAEYLAKNADSPAVFFIRDPESDAAIKVQHDLLKELIKDKGLLEYFETHRQEKPLVLTHEGFVLNGNRRLCAMRLLHEKDPKAYSHFEHVDVVILPPAEEKDIDELEAQLQIHKDIKADYTWITFALMLKRRQEDHRYTADHLARLYEMKTSEINERLDMLTYAEDYLNERGWSGEYHRVEQAKYAFEQIRKKRSKFSTEQEKEVFEKISYALLDNPEGGRLYDLIPESANYFEKILDHIGDELELPEVPEETVPEDLLGGKRVSTSRNYQTIIDAFGNDQNRENIRAIVIDVVKGEQLKEKEKKRKNFVLNQVKKANAALTDAANAIISDTSKSGISEQIEAIDISLDKLRSWLNG